MQPWGHGLHHFARFHTKEFDVASKNFLLKALPLAALMCASGASHAILTVYTSQAAFNAASASPGVDTYTGFSIIGTTPSPILRTAGAYSYTATASTSTFFGAGTTGNPWLSTNIATDSITFNAFSAGVSAFGGNFFGSDINGLFLAGNVTLVATDSLGATSTQTIVGPTVTSFLGFVSNAAMTSVVLSAVQGAAPLWPTADNVTLATAVPEPGSYALLLAGLGVVGFMARRRRG